MIHTTLIEPRVLYGHLEDRGWRVIDCRFDLMNPHAGKEQWRHGHIPGATHADLDQDLTGPTGPETGRHPLPDPGELAAWAGRQGIDESTQVVAYDADSGAFAARLWWLLRWLGHQAVAVLDGGLARWSAEGFPLDTGEPAPRRRHFDGHPDRGQRVTTEALAASTRSEFLVVDARSPERFRGDVEPIDPVAGHLPGARNRPFPNNLDAEGRWRSREALRAEWSCLLEGTPPQAVVHMCGSGVTACHNTLAMEHAGLPGSRLYPGSWSEWITDSERPVAQGREDDA